MLYLNIFTLSEKLVAQSEFYLQRYIQVPTNFAMYKDYKEIQYEHSMFKSKKNVDCIRSIFNFM